MARPVRAVRSGASVSETKPTPRCSSSCEVLSRSVTERPQRSKRHTSSVSISRRRAASSGFEQFLASLALCRTGANLLDLHDNGPTPPCGILPQGTILHGKRLLVVGGHAGIQASTKRSSPP